MAAQHNSYPFYCRAILKTNSTSWYQLTDPKSFGFDQGIHAQHQL